MGLNFFQRLDRLSHVSCDPELLEARRQLAALHRVQAVIEFDLDGTVLTANENFLAAVGYRLDEVQGQHHRMFVDPEHAASDAYRQFWEHLHSGRFHAGRFRRINHAGAPIWIEASYNPVLDADGKPYKIVKFATDITAQMREAADFAGQIAAISKAQAVIEFALDGTILAANDNFLAALGYTFDEIRGRHHSMFVDARECEGEAYRRFWQDLGAGQYNAGRFQRIGKGGASVWIQASYNPILDADGKPFKVVKFACDISEAVRQEQALQRTVEDVSRVVAGACGGDLRERVALDTQSGAVADLCQGLNAILGTMEALVRQVAEASQSVHMAALEIAAGNDDFSRRTEMQAASLEETASSMEEMAATVKASADNARHASELARGASGVAHDGNVVVAQVVATMGEIDQRSRKIGDIIGVIDGIAFQTNILALNAAVEAARAGEQGRGFAVVASEVRILAHRSATAAKEIKGLIADSVDTVGAGSRLVAEAGATMEQVMSRVQQVTELMTEIANASQEQSAGIGLINQSIASMDENTQQNAALVEEAAASAHGLQQQADQLVRTVSGYRVGTASAGALERSMVAA